MEPSYLVNELNEASSAASWICCEVKMLWIHGLDLKNCPIKSFALCISTYSSHFPLKFRVSIPWIMLDNFVFYLLTLLDIIIIFEQSSISFSIQNILYLKFIYLFFLLMMEFMGLQDALGTMKSQFKWKSIPQSHFLCSASYFASIFPLVLMFNVSYLKNN